MKNFFLILFYFISNFFYDDSCIPDFPFAIIPETNIILTREQPRGNWRRLGLNVFTIVISYEMIIDSYNRIHNYLRISLTDNCNLRCFYCMPEEDYEFTPASRLMQLQEIEALGKIFVELGV